MKSWIPEDLRGRTRSNIMVVWSAILLAAVIYYFGTIMGFVKSLLTVAEPFIIGFGLAFLMLPVVGKVELFFNKLVFHRRPHPRGSRILATIVSVLLLLALVAGFVAILLPQLITSIKSILQYVGSFISANSTKINEFLLKYEFLSIEGEQLVISWENIISEMMSNLSLLTDNVRAIVEGIGGGIYAVVFHFLVGLIAAFYLLLDKETFCAQVKKLCYAAFKPSTVETLVYWTRRANQIFVGFITGKIMDSLIIGIICYICMLIFRIEYPLLISVIVGLTNIIPFFGPFIGAVPSILILLLVNPLSALWFGVFILVLQQLDGNVIGPFILGDYVGLNAFWIMIAIVIGGGMFGFAGMLLGVPIFALIYAIIRTIAETRLKARSLPAETEFYVGAPENLQNSDGGASSPADTSPETSGYGV